MTAVVLRIVSPPGRRSHLAQRDRADEAGIGRVADVRRYNLPGAQRCRGKDNWPAFCAEVERFFALADPQTFNRHETTDCDHGRIEVRRHAVGHDIEWLTSARRFPGEWRFEGLAMVAIVETEIERGGKINRKRRYHLSSARLSAKQFAAAVRSLARRKRLHGVMDVVFHDDLMRLRTRNGPANVATFKHTSLNLIHQIDDKPVSK